MINELPLVSLVVVSYNEISHIRNSLNALINQEYRNCEVIVYDNASSDGTPEYVAENFPNVLLIRGKKNLGFGGANNEAVKIAHGKYIAFLNCDATVAPDWLLPIVNLLETDDSVGCVGAELVCSENPQIILSHGTGIHLSGISYTKDRGKKVGDSKPIEVGGISGGAVVINRDFFIKVGCFESLFFLYYEDTDLALRIRMSGKKCMIFPGAYIYHNCESRFKPRKLFFLERNRYLSLFSLMSPLMLIIMAPSMLVFEIFAWGFCILSGKDAFTSKAQAWKEIIANRNWISSRRKRYADGRASFSYILQAFTPFVHIDYVHSSRIWGVASLVVGYLIAAPAFLVMRLFTGNSYLK